MMEVLSLRVALGPDVMTTVRLATGGVCSLLSLSYDDGEDCKVCVTESLLLLLRGGYARANVVFSDGEALSVRVEGEGTAQGGAESDEDEIQLALINALAQNVQMRRSRGTVSAVSFTFGKQA